MPPKKDVAANSDTSLEREVAAMEERAGSTAGGPTVVTPAVEEKPVVVPPVAAAPAAPVVEAPAPVSRKEPEAPAAAVVPAVVPKVETKPHTERPERYIPVPKYTSEKQAWNTEKQTLLTTIAKAKGFEPGSAEETTAVQEFATKANITEEAARAALDLARQSLFPKELQEGFTKILTESTKADEAAAIAAKAKEEEEFFGTEYTPFQSEHLDTAYPNATDEQKTKARELMDQLSHVREYARLSLADIFALPKVRKQFDELIAPATAADAPPAPPAPAATETAPRKGPEASKPGGAAATTLKASDFVKDAKTKKYDFAPLHNMADGADKQTLISALEPEAYVAYIDDLGARDTSLTVRRGDQEVTLN